MASALTIDGKEYTSATIAGKHFGYTKDYLLMLIKGGKIDGQKIGNKWYVHVPSAEDHFRTAHMEQAARRRVLSLERKQEIQRFAKVKKIHSPHTALVETLVIVVIGLSIGATGYLGTSVGQTASVSDTSTSFVKELAIKLYTLISPSDVLPTVDGVETITTTQGLVQNQNSHGAAVAASSSTTPSSLIVAPSEVFTEDSVKVIQDSFSDPVLVSVDPENPETGIITPIFKEGTQGEEYRFLMVPVTKK